MRVCEPPWEIDLFEGSRSSKRIVRNLQYTLPNRFIFKLRLSCWKALRNSLWLRARTWERESLCLFWYAGDMCNINVRECGTHKWEWRQQSLKRNDYDHIFLSFFSLFCTECAVCVWLLLITQWEQEQDEEPGQQGEQNPKLTTTNEGNSTNMPTIWGIFLLTSEDSLTSIWASYWYFIR